MIFSTSVSSRIAQMSSSLSKNLFVLPFFFRITNSLKTASSKKWKNILFVHLCLSYTSVVIYHHIVFIHPTHVFIVIVDHSQRSCHVVWTAGKFPFIVISHGQQIFISSVQILPFFQFCFRK